MNKNIRFFFFTVLILFLLDTGANAQLAEITESLNYLSVNQNPNGSWGNETSITEILPTTIEVIETLKVWNQTSTSNYSNAISWLQNQSLETTDYLSERIYSLSVAGPDNSLVLTIFP